MLPPDRNMRYSIPHCIPTENGKKSPYRLETAETCHFVKPRHSANSGNAGVAQKPVTLPSEGRGREFESRRVRHIRNLQQINLRFAQRPPTPATADLAVVADGAIRPQRTHHRPVHLRTPAAPQRLLD